MIRVLGNIWSIKYSPYIIDNKILYSMLDMIRFLVYGKYYRYLLHYIFSSILILFLFILNNNWNNGRDRMVVGFTTTYVISVYHH